MPDGSGPRALGKHQDVAASSACVRSHYHQLAALAETQAQLRDRLQELAPPVPEDLRLAWEATARDALEAPPADRRPQPRLEAQFAVLVTCRDEAQQVDLLRRFHAEGLECKALLS